MSARALMHSAGQHPGAKKRNSRPKGVQMIVDEGRSEAQYRRSEVGCRAGDR